MDIRLIIAILAFLAFALLPVLDHFANSEINAKGIALLPDPYRTLGE